MTATRTSQLAFREVARRFQVKWCAVVALCATLVGLAGCGVAAAPCRVASAGLKMVPLVGHVAAAPTDACASVIDP
jgi:hypothetical protein